MIRKDLLAAALAAPMVLMSQAALAQTADAWQFQGIIYAYVPTIGGKTTFPQGAAGSDVTVSPDKIIDSLKGVFMGSLEANNGRWGGFTDLMYLDLGGSKSGTRDFAVGRVELPVGASANASLDIKGTIWTLGGSYRLMTSPSAKMDLLAGARLFDMKQSLNWSLAGNIGPVPLPGRAGNLDTSINNWDAIVGLKGRIALGDEKKWFAPYYVDVGTGNSDLTWQATAGIGYSFHWGEVLAAWRYLDYKFKSGKPIESMNFNGPAIAAVFHW
jgi:hypothetical protein